jgi:hypothetical protein
MMKIKTQTMYKIILLAFIAILCATTAFGQTSQESTKAIDTKNWKTFKGDGFSIQYPDTFNLDKSGESGTSFTLMSKLIITAVIQDMKGRDMDLDKYVKLSEAEINTEITDSKLLESKRLKDNYGNECHRIAFTGKHSDFSFNWIQYYWVKKNKAYILTVCGQVELSDKYFKDGEAIMKTFKIK